MLDISNLPNRRVTTLVDPANLTGRQLYERVTGFPVIEDHLLPRTARNLPPSPRGKFHIMDRSS